MVDEQFHITDGVCIWGPPISSAAKVCRTDMVEMLLEFGADANTVVEDPDIHSRSLSVNVFPVHCALAKGGVE